MHNMVPVLDSLVSIALDLTSALSADDRHDRLVARVYRALRCDSVALMRRDGDALVAIATRGLADDVLGRRYLRSAHPRLDAICGAARPIQFPADSDLPDPFDGAFASDATALSRVHACLGCPLRVEGELIGVLAADALDPKAFDELDSRFLDALGALAGAALRTSDLIDALSHTALRHGLIASELMRESHQSQELQGLSAPMQRVRKDIALSGPSDLPVLVSGETGVGKELVARAIHAASKRSHAPLHHVNCAAFSESLADAELFGHTKGAFTGASAERHGKFYVADGATLFLDEVGELPLSIQPKLLRVLQQGELQRVGSDRILKVDVRVLAATNRNLEEAVATGRFRSDLYHRLNVFPVQVPALREHLDDIPILVGHFCEAVQPRLGLGPVRFQPEALRALSGYAWPGNVRELENVVSRLAVRAAANTTPGDRVIISADMLGPEFSEAGGNQTEPWKTSTADSRTLSERLDDYQREVIRKTLRENADNWAATARALGLHRSNLHHRASRLGLL